MMMGYNDWKLKGEALCRIVSRTDHLEIGNADQVVEIRRFR